MREVTIRSRIRVFAILYNWDYDAVYIFFSSLHIHRVLRKELIKLLLKKRDLQSSTEVESNRIFHIATLERLSHSPYSLQ